jgi:hypothetical protein
MSEVKFTPQWEAIKWGYRAALDGIRETGLEEADRWLAAHDAQVRREATADAMADAIKYLASTPAVTISGQGGAAQLLRARAARIREGQEP